MKKKLDKFDKAILNAIQKDCRISNKKLGAEIGLTETPVNIRIQNMHKAGYIKRFAAVLDADKIGYELIAYVHVKLQDHSENNLSNYIAEAMKMEEVMEFYHVTGSIDFIMRIAVKNMKEWKSFFNTRLVKMPGIPHYETSLVVTEVRCETAVVVR
jgi:Lrp/AsnC family leucine-responsive transcriptional regulator